MKKLLALSTAAIASVSAFAETPTTMPDVTTSFLTPVTSIAYSVGALVVSIALVFLGIALVKKIRKG